MLRPSFSSAVLTVSVVFAFLVSSIQAASVHSAHGDVEVQARETLLSQLPPSVRADLESRDASEYELGYQDILKRTLEKRRTPSKRDGTKKCSKKSGGKKASDTSGKNPDGGNTKASKNGDKGTKDNLDGKPWRSEYNPDKYTGKYHKDGCLNGQIAITIDDGPNADWTNVTRDAIQKNNAGGDVTYFMNGFNFDCLFKQTYADWCKSILDAGGVVGSHTWSHVDFTKSLTLAEIDEQVGLTEEAMYKVCGVIPRTMRLPYGSINDTVQDHLTSKWGYDIVYWTGLSGDADDNEKNMDAQLAAWRQIKDGTIFLVHEQAIEGLTKGMKILYKDLNKKSVTIDKCLGLENPYKVKAKPQKPDSTWTCDGKPIPGKGYGTV